MMTAHNYFYTPDEQARYEPADWQQKDIDYLATRDWSANWSEMGCYKTTTALWLFNKKLLTEYKVDGTVVSKLQDDPIYKYKPIMGDHPRILVITTKAGKGTYYDAVPKTIPGWELYSVDGVGEGKTEFQLGDVMIPWELEAPFAANITKPTVIVAHYHCFTNNSKIKALIGSISYDAIILDEAHRIKEMDSQWTRNIKKLKSNYKHVMTGTGFINRPDEIFSLLNFLNSDLFTSYWEFRRTFCDEYHDNESGTTKILGVKEEMKEVFRNMRKTIGPRRVKNGPDGVFEGVLERPLVTKYPVELNPIQRKMYDELKHTLYTLDQQGVPIYSANVLALLNRLRQVCVATPEKVSEHFDEASQRLIQEIKLVEPSSKLTAVMDILESLEWDDENKQQVVVFSNFKDPIELLKVRLTKARIPYLHMEAKMNDNQRYELWHDIFPKKEHQVFLSTLQLGSESINLTPAEYAIFLDRSWSPKDNEQGVGRIYRPGQTKVPQVIHINAVNTTDQRVERTNKIKQGWFNEIFGEDEEV